MPPAFPTATVRQSGDQTVLELGSEPPKELRPGSAWRLGLVASDAAVLLREGAKVEGFFAGSLSALSLGELFGHLLSGVRSGRLLVTYGGVRKQVVLRDGQVVFATSTQPHERLGAVVVQRGLVRSEEVEQALLEIEPGERLGQVLVRTGRLTTTQLYGAMSQLVRNILVDLFEVSDGEFLFIEGEPSLTDSVKLAERTRDLVLEGISRGEEVQNLRHKWPLSLSLRRGRSPAGGKGVLASPSAARLWEAVGTGTDVGSLFLAFEGSQHDFLLLLNQLAAAGVVVPKPATEPARGQPRARPQPQSHLERYQALLEELVQGLQHAGTGVEPLRAFLREPGPRLKEAFEGVAISDEGRLDVKALQEKLGQDAAGRARVQEALDAFLSYALFCAQNVLAQEPLRSLQDQASALRQGR